MALPKLYQPPGNGFPASETSISSIDGDLQYRGYSVEELVEQSNFTETVHLIVKGALPTHEEVADLEATLAEAAVLEPQVLKWVEQLPFNASAIDVLRAGVSLISLTESDGEDPSPHAVWQTLLRLLAQMPILVATRDRIARGLPLVESRTDLTYAANLLWLLTGEEPSSQSERALDAFLILCAEHEFSPSTCAVRLVASTRSDFPSAIIAGLSTIKGVWHGGPGGQIIDILEAVATPEAAKSIVTAVLKQYERLPGFWHRVYRTSDPRAELLAPFCRRVAEERGRLAIEDVAAGIESAVWDVQQVLPCLDWPAARLLHHLKLNADLFVPLFAISRIVGWAAHYLEQQQFALPIRPRGTYIGQAHREYEPLEERG